MQVRIGSMPVLTSLLLVGVLSLVVGCGGDPNMSAVSGTVKANGKAVSGGEIMFYPQGGGRPSVGVIDLDGQYELTSKRKGDGAAPGPYDVTITVFKSSSNSSPSVAESVEDETEADMLMEGERVVWLIPMKYSELGTTTLTAEVKKGKNEINFDSADF